MQAYWPSLLAAALVFAVFSVAAAFAQRRRAAHLARRLAEAEHSRLHAEDEARTLRRRFGVPTRPPALHDLDERRQVLERALAPSPPSPPPAVDADPWVDTQPMTMTGERRAFAPTRPMPEQPPG